MCNRRNFILASTLHTNFLIRGIIQLLGLPFLKNIHISALEISLWLIILIFIEQSNSFISYILTHYNFLPLHPVDVAWVSGDIRWSGDNLVLTRSVDQLTGGDLEGLPFKHLVGLHVWCIRDNGTVALIGPCFVAAPGEMVLRILCVWFDIIIFA